MANMKAIIILLMMIRQVCSDFTVLLDAGSTGTRVYVYSYDKEQPFQSINEIARKRSMFPLSSFVNNATGLSEQITSLIQFAKTKVPFEEWSNTNISLKATAGLRSLSDESQIWLISQTASILANSDFLFYPSDTKVISGEEEALYDFLAIKILLQKNNNDNIKICDNCTIGAADLGGSSQQIAFAFHHKRENSIIDDHIDTIPVCSPDWLLGSNEILAKSLKRRGLIAAMDDVVSKFYDNLCNNSNNTDSKSCNNNDDVMYHPCLSPGSTDYYEDSNIEPLNGLGDFDQCLEFVRNTLLEDTYFTPKCLHNHANHPYMIIGMDNYPKVLEILKLSDNGVLSPLEIATAGRNACKRTWTDLLSDFPGYKPYRAQRACFGATYVYLMLTDVYGLNPNDKAFIAIENLGNMELSWTLGAAIVGTSANLVPTYLGEM
jgi:hypothetical protein